ncbi:hypothetical protein NIBR502772_10950 [Pseudarthrobacter sp. NIBRBAC000502772]|uniref:hypothetical protein n=1 Tax=Pseudarthrobacter sp. NIBRBAC000502772 TaxID=2590775 RepID=UPI001131FCDE|nr:hypothetical protein [Pseudarthrobacter sp. NIBRBAC000502772]QDG66658.1 hypothetical protein NIBR502772_10950 [Pseudarthrobacter sp. NIBRBAC000502772]
MVNQQGKIEAKIWSWRVYSIHHDYLSKRSLDQHDQINILENTPRRGDTLTTRLGNLPGEYYETQKKVAASLRALFGAVGSAAPDWLLSRDDFIDSITEEMPIEPVPGKTWLTIELSRSVIITDNTGSRYLWNDMAECEELLVNFKRDRKMAFEAAAAAIAGVNPEWLRYPQTDPERVYIGAEGKEPTINLQLEVGEPIVSGQRDWAELSPSSAEEIGYATRILMKPENRRIIGPASWLTAARSETSDSFRRFMFAYFGLEMLATSFENAKRKQTVQKLEVAAGAPLDELMWPKPNDDSKDPSRNSMFNFAIMAVALSPDPRADINAFRPMKKSRDSIAHGSSVDIGSLPAAEAEALLLRYLGLVSKEKIYE